MTRRTRGRFVLFLCLCSAGAGVFYSSACRPRSGDDRVVIKIGTKTVTAGAFEQAMAVRGGATPQVFEKPENRMALAEELIRSEVMARQAEREGLLRDPAIQAAVQRLLAEEWERRVLEKAALSAPFPSNEVEQAYRQNLARYRLPAGVRAALVFVRTPPGVTPDKKAALRTRAEEARREAIALPGTTPHFGPVAARYSDDQATRYSGGESGWERQEGGFGRWPGAVAETVAGLTQTGQVSEVIETDPGFFLVKLMERRDGTVLPLDAVRANVQRDLAIRKKKDVLDRAYAEARKGIRIVVDEDALRRVPAPRPPAAPVPVNPSDD